MSEKTRVISLEMFLASRIKPENQHHVVLQKIKDKTNKTKDVEKTEKMQKILIKRAK